MTASAIIAPKKLIEVALPLEEINKAAAREKSIRQGHPSTLHLWWARRPLAAARAVLFAQLVNDPSWKYSQEELRKPQIKSAITRKRNDLLRLIIELVKWENTKNEQLLDKARSLIRESWAETCEANKSHSSAEVLRFFDPERLPPFHDPFAGGGSLPLEAQRLGLEAHASDLNPVAVLINKAMIEFPPKFLGRPPIGPVSSSKKQTNAKVTDDWSGTRGLAEDVRRYGSFMRAEAFRRLKQLYPKIKITKTLAKDWPDLAKYEGQELTVVAWLWARTIPSPNPAANNVDVPLVASFLLSSKLKMWAQPIIEKNGKGYRFKVLRLEKDPALVETVNRQGAVCVMTGSPIPFSYIRDKAKKGHLGQRLMAIVAEGESGRVYLEPTEEAEEIARQASPPSVAETKLPPQALSFRIQEYGMLKHRDLFTRRQLAALATFADVVLLAREDAIERAVAAGVPRGERLEAGGTGAVGYADAIAVYLSFLVAAVSDDLSTIVTWRATHGTGATRSTFARQALPMTWDFAEANPFAGAAGDLESSATALALVITHLGFGSPGHAVQADAATEPQFECAITSTDPPYFDNIGYADLSDFFYVWHRQSLREIMPSLFGSILVPKEQELIATPYRHGGKKEAEEFFLSGMEKALSQICKASTLRTPFTIYYAFKQSETTEEAGTASTGWGTFLEALLRAGAMISGTWPMRTERAVRSVGLGTNALASSIVLVCRPRDDDALTVSRRDFLRELERTMPDALAAMMEGIAIAPVDLAQAAIGPGIAVFSRFKAVLEADGSPMSVYNALIHINKAVDDFFTNVEGDFDADTRFCVGWFQQRGFEAGPFGEADVLARAKGTSVEGIEQAGVIQSGKGKVRLLRVKDYPKDWDPTKDDRTPIWEACHQMCRALQDSENEAGRLLARMPDKQDAIRQLAYRLYTLCERKGWADEARSYNELVASWSSIVEESHKVGHRGEQMGLI